MARRWIEDAGINHIDDDTAGLFRQERGKFLTQEQRRPEVDIHVQGKRAGGCRCRIVPFEHRGIVDQHIESRRRLCQRIDQRLRCIVPCEIGAERERGSCAARVQFRYQACGIGFRGVVMDRNVVTGRVQGARDARAEATCAAGYQCQRSRVIERGRSG